MPANFNRPTYYPSEISLVEDIVLWLNDRPSFEEICTYVATLPEDLQEPISYQAATRFLEKLFEEKQEYFTKNNAQAFVSALYEDDQLTYISFLTNTSPDAVKEGMLKMYPAVSALTFPKDVESWAKQFMGKFYTCLYLAIVPEYFLLRLYGHSLVRSIPQEKLAELEPVLEENLAGIHDRFLHSVEPTAADKEVERKLLSQLTFLPKAAQEDWLAKNDTQDKLEMFTSVQKVLVLIQAMYITGMKQEEIDSRLEKAIVAQLIEENQEPVVEKLTALHDAAYGGQALLREFTDLITQVFTLENLRKSHIADQLVTKYNSLAADQQAFFSLVLYSFLATDTLCEVLIDPFVMSQVLAGLKEQKNAADLEEYIKSVHEGLEDQLLAFDCRTLLLELYKIVQNIPEVEPVKILQRANSQPPQPVVATQNV